MNSIIKNRWGKIFIILSITVFIMGCGVSSTISPTPTPTDVGLPISNPNDPCAGLSGELEMQVLVGPAEIVGLDPFAVGNIPFSVTSESGASVITGNSAVIYQDVLTREWGTYTVEFDLVAVITGTCDMSGDNGVLNMTVQTSGNQMVEVRAEGFQGDYPWSGTHEFMLNLPIEDGAKAEGEGWAFLLHLNK